MKNLNFYKGFKYETAAISPSIHVECKILFHARLKDGKVEKSLKLIQRSFCLVDLELRLDRYDSGKLRNRKLDKR